MATTPVKKHFTFTIKEFYKEYRLDKRSAGVPCKNIIDYKTYKKIIEDFFVEIMKKIIYENYCFMMPYSLGSILVKSFKTNLKKALVDFKTTRAIGKVVKYINQHTFGYYFGIVWDKSYVRFKNNAYYSFSATSSAPATKLGIGKKALSDHINELSQDPTKRSYIRL